MKFDIGQIQRDKSGNNRTLIRDFFIGHPGCTQIECAIALGMNVHVVGRHVRAIREEWKSK